MLAAGSAQVFGNDEAAHPGRSQLLPDTVGEISAVALAVNSARRAALRNAALVGNIVNGLPTGVQVSIIANDPAAFIVANNPWPERIHFIELPPSSAITIWTQDPFLVLRGVDGATTLLTSREFERAGDSAFAALLGRSGDYAVRPSELYFEGGNVVSDPEHIFIGANTIRYNAVQLDLQEVEVVRRFQEELGRRVLVVGPWPQPVAHIDMILTPVGDRRVVLADAAAGARIAERALEADPESVRSFERACEEDFFGHPAIRRIVVTGGAEIEAPELTGKTREMAVLSRQLAPVLDGIAGALQGHGYTVLRVPFLYGGPESQGAVPAPGEPVAAYPMLTYNNVLIESRPQGAGVVYLPRYGWPAMDQAAAEAWQSLGFEPRAIDGLTVSSMYGGALRCSVKVLERRLHSGP